MDQELRPISAHRRTGEERFSKSGAKTNHTLLGFWQWAGSDLIDNTYRGWLAEYIIATAVDVAGGLQQGWAPFDILTPEGTRVEVKASAYIQSWNQKKLSTPSFSIRRALAWDPETNAFSTSPERNSDVYVFCLHHHQDQNTIDPLNLDQWTFYVLPTAIIDQQLGNQKTVGLGRIKSAGAVEVAYGEIYSTIKSELRQ